MTALHNAAWSGQKAAMRLLLAAKADVHARDAVSLFVAYRFYIVYRQVF